MADVKLLAVVLAAVAAFLAGGAYYAVLGDRLAHYSTAGATMGAGTVVVEVIRCLIIASVVAGLLGRTSIDTWAGGILLGLVLWIGFPLVLWIGAIAHENTPLGLAAIHAGDWLLKLILVGGILGAWR
ncbi:MAG: DUF1761 domain-containing protein [Nocardioides sp.]